MSRKQRCLSAVWLPFFAYDAAHVFGVSDQVGHKLTCSASDNSWSDTFDVEHMCCGANYMGVDQPTQPHRSA